MGGWRRKIVEGLVQTDNNDSDPLRICGAQAHIVSCLPLLEELSLSALWRCQRGRMAGSLAKVTQAGSDKDRICTL